MERHTGASTIRPLSWGIMLICGSVIVEDTKRTIVAFKAQQ